MNERTLFLGTDRSIQKPSSFITTTIPMPKYIEIDAVERTNSLLDGISAGDTTLFARIEPYSFKASTEEKRLFKKMDSQRASQQQHLHQAQSPTLGPNEPLNGGAHKRAARDMHDEEDEAQEMGGAGSYSDADDRMVLGSPPKRPRVRTLSGAGISAAAAAYGTSPMSAVSPKINADAALPAFDSGLTLGPAALANSVGGTAHDALALSRSPVFSLAHSADGGAEASDAAMAAAAAQDPELARKTFYGFIATMNAAYPDYDFSDTPMSAFRAVSHKDVIRSVHTHMGDVARAREADLWGAVAAAFTTGGAPSPAESATAMAECEVYVYDPTAVENDPLHEEGTIWCHTVFYFHRKLKRVALVKLRAVSYASNPFIFFT
ncbi:Maf1 regulator-domain-containing protein [Blastocladiella britannica]|nr:Maf1 regulator-domain-containing protein [Blastocladiella britannica]